MNPVPLTSLDAAGHALTETNTSTGAVLDLAWNIAGDMTSVTSKNSSGVTQWVVGYTYDMFGDLIGRSCTPYSGGSPGTTQTQRFVIDPATGETVLEFNGSGSRTDRFLWGPLVDQNLADEKTSGVGFANNIEWMFTNNTGSVVDVYDSNWGGSGYGGGYGMLDHLIYNAFGGIVSQSNSYNAPLFGYNGEFTDPITGFQYHNDPASGEIGRWYNPASQRWLSEDPIFPLSGSNPFEYCGNAPTDYFDTDGLAGERYNGYDQSVDVDTYNCVGLAFRTYTYIGSVPEFARMVTQRGGRILAPGAKTGPRELKVILWEYKARLAYSDGTLYRNVPDDFHVVAGICDAQGKEQKNAYSKDGQRPVQGPESPSSFRPKDKEPYLNNDPKAQPAEDPSTHKPIWIFRTDIEETDYAIPVK